MMYNEELKRRFIDNRLAEVTLPVNYLSLQFKKVSKTEERLNKDICNFSFYEIIEYYKSLNTTSEGYLRVLNSQFSIYTNWCLAQNLVLDGQNHFMELRREDYDGCTNKALKNLSLLSKEIIYDMVDQLPNPRDKFCLLCLFEGIKGKSFSDITLLKPEDFNGNMVTLPSGKIIEVSDELVEIKDLTIATNVYYAMTGCKKREIPLMDLGYIIKEYPNVETNSELRRARRMYNQFCRIFSFLGVEYLKMNDVYISGLVHKIKVSAQKRNMTVNEFGYSNFFHEDIESIYGVLNYKKVIIEKCEDCL